MIVTVKCSHCGREFSKKLEDEKVIRVLLHGEPVQDVFPELSANDRELFFVSQICGDCWNKLFGVTEPKDNEENADIPQGMIDEMAEMYYEMQAEIARGK